MSGPEDVRGAPTLYLRRAVSAIAFAFVLAILGAVAFRATRLVRSEQAPGIRGRYNVLLVTVDSLRADRLGCYGSARARTPVLDRLAAEGVLFEEAQTAAPITLPAHVSILTGTYPAWHGVRNDGGYRLGPRAVTLAEVFHEQGYRTGAVVSGPPLVARFGLAQGFDAYDDRLPPARPRHSGPRERSAEEVSRAGVAWLAANGKERFFLWLHYFAPHAPYTPPYPFAEQFARFPYDGEVAYVDSEVAKVFEFLRRQDLLDETLIVVVADHGEGLGDHGEATHGVFLYESTLRVPLILSLPRVLPRGRRVGTPVRTIDLMPTILRIAELPEPDSVQGTSLLPLTARRRADLVLKSLSESLLPRENYGWSELAAVRVGDWKYILAPREELYDLGEDPGEKHNLAESRSSDTVRFQEEIHRLLADAAPIGPPAGQHQELDEAARDRLRALGYLWAPGPAGRGEAPDPKDRAGILATLDRAGAQLRKGDFRSALATAEEALAADPENTAARFLRGGARVETGDFAGAAADFEAVLAGRPRSPELLWNLGTARLGEGQLNEATRIFRQVLDLDPDSDRALGSLGAVLARQGHHLEAAEMFRRALAFNPASPGVRLGLAAALAAGGRLEDSEEEYRRAIDLDPSDPAPVLGLARILRVARRDDEVVALVEESLQAGAENPDLHLALGDAHLGKGEIAQAAEEYARVLRARPEDPRALLGASLVALRRGRTEEAAGLLHRVHAGDPGDPAARRRLGQLHDEAGRLDEAISEYRAALRLEPGDRELRFRLASAYARSGRTREAEAEYRAYLAAGDGEFAEAARRELARLSGS
jgi:arylsulfatase A-like enzyme/Flp pilus assembly protein TadD